MASKVNVKTTFEPARVIEPIYTGGDVSLDSSGQILASCVEDEALIVDIERFNVLARLDGDGEPITSLALSPTASHLVLCSRSLTMRIYALNSLDQSKTITPTLQRTLKPHDTPVVTTSIDHSGTLLATGAADGTIKLWDIRGGFVTHTFHGHGGVISALCFFQTSRGGPNSTNGMGKKRKRENDMPASKVNHQDDNTVSAYFLASGSEEGKIRIWDLQKRKSSAVLDSHVSVVRSLDFSKFQNALISGSRDKTMIVWDPSTWKPRKVIPVLEVVETAGFLGQGLRCFSGGEHGHLRIWDINNGKEMTTEGEPGSESDAIVATKYAPSSSVLVSVHVDQTLRLYDSNILATIDDRETLGEVPVIRRISGNHDEVIDMAFVGPSHDHLALATNTESIKIVAVRENDDQKDNSEAPSSSGTGIFGSELALLEGHSDIVICMATDWSGNWLATGAKDNTARLWRLDPLHGSYTCFAKFIGHAESIGAVALPQSPPPPNSQAYGDPPNHPPSFLLTGSQDRTVKKWNTSKLQLLPDGEEPHTVAKAQFTRVAHEKDINAIDVCSNQALFASASQDRTIKVWSLEDGSVAGILRSHKRGVWSVKFAPKDAPPLKISGGGTASSRGLVASGSGDRTVKIWSLSTYQCLLTFEGHSNSVLKVLWISPSQPETKETTDSDDELPERNRPEHHQKALPIIASASSDTLIKLWSPYTSTSATADPLLATLDNHTDRVWALATPTTTTSSSSSTPSPTSPSYPLTSGAADGRLTFWRDTTSTTLALAASAASARIEQAQDLENHILTQNYREAITLALTLNHPGRLLKLFQDVLSTNPEENDNDNDDEGEGGKKGGGAVVMGRKEVDEVLASLDDEQIWALLQRVRDWNTNARTSGVAQRVLHLILRRYSRERLLGVRRRRTQQQQQQQLGNLTGEGGGVGGGGLGGGKGGSLREMLRALEVYTERHYRRVEDLMDESYLVDYTLKSMDEVLGS
ncbi:MAG: hypothetical protein Q9227_003307 [Pyrenula ochraceoflavens]